MLSYHVWVSHEARCAPLCARLMGDSRACDAAGFARPQRVPGRRDGEGEWDYGAAKYLP